MKERAREERRARPGSTIMNRRDGSGPYDGVEPAGRYASLDGLRGLMMLLGVYLHAGIAYSEHGSWPWKDGTTTAVFDISLGLIHVFRMPVFYVLAGFFAALLLERWGCTGFIRNRAVRILVPFAAGWLVLFPLVASLAVAAASLQDGGSGLAAALRVFTSLDILRRRPDPMHLWFLEYLLMFYVAAIAAAPLSRRLGGAVQRLDRRFRANLTGPFGPFALSMITCPILLFMENGAIDDTYGFAPDARILAAYALFFAWGWLLWRNVDLLPALRNASRAALLLGAAAVVGLLGYFLWYWRGVHGGGMPLVFIASGWCLALSMWLFVFGLIGLFLSAIARPVPWIRYVADSSYWLYLAHMPVLLAFQILLADSGWPPSLKALAALSGSLVTLFASYHLLVRPTWVGAILNGRRYPIGPGREWRVRVTSPRRALRARLTGGQRGERGLVLDAEADPRAALRQTQ